MGLGKGNGFASLRRVTAGALEATGLPMNCMSLQLPARPVFANRTTRADVVGELRQPMSKALQAVAARKQEQHQKTLLRSPCGARNCPGGAKGPTERVAGQTLRQPMSPPHPTHRLQARPQGSPLRQAPEAPSRGPPGTSSTAQPIPSHARYTPPPPLSPPRRHAGR